MDHRLLTEDGRNAIKNDFIDTAEHGQDIARAASTVSADDNIGLLNFGEILDKNAKGTQLKNDLLRNPEHAHILAGLNSSDPDAHAQATQDLGHLAQTKFGLELSDISFYDASETTSASLADTTLTDVKGATIVDNTHDEYGNIFIDGGDGASKTDLVNTLGHEVIETETLQGQGNGLSGGLFGEHNADTQEAIANAFGEQLSDRINQAAGGDLDNSGGPDFAANLKNSDTVRTGTERANSVGGSEVEHRQLYVQEAQAILNAAPTYAKQQGISEAQAKRDLTRQALRQVDKTWSEQIEENPAAREMIDLLRASTAPIEDRYVEGGLVGAFIATPEDKANPYINANEASLLESGHAIEGEEGFMSQYATATGELPVELTPVQQLRESVSGTVEGVTELAESLSNDYPGTMNALAEGIGNAVSDCTDLSCMTVDMREGYAGDQAFVDLLQGDRESAIANNSAVIAGEVLPLAPAAAKGAGAVKEVVGDAVGEVIEEAAEQAAKKADAEINRQGPDSNLPKTEIPNSTSNDLTPVVISNMPKELSHQATSGVKLVANPDKTTTVLGSYVSDTSKIIDELNYPKNLDFDAKQGGFNVLNTPDEFYKNPTQFWSEYNKPFLDKAIRRGDDIILTTKPTKNVLVNPKTGELTGYGKEFKYLQDQGYRYDANSSKMVKDN